MQIDRQEFKDKLLFNSIAKEYFAKDINPVSTKARKFQLLSLIDLYFQNVIKNNLGNILELGCGAGASTEYLRGYFKTYLGIDYSDDFINLANENFAKDNIRFICGNIKDIQIDVASNIDFVFGIGVLHHVSNLEQVLKNLAKIGNNETVYGFIEPQASNPFIQLLRKIRMIVDNKYSNDQIFFKKKDVINIFEQNNFKLIEIKYQGYFTPPFAQVIIKPKIIFAPIVDVLTKIDRLIQQHLNNPLAWNLIWIAMKK